MLYLKINKKQVWGKPTKEIQLQNYEQTEAINAKTTHDKAGHKTRPLGLMARPPALTPHLFDPSFVHGLVHISYFLFSYILLSASN
jgi:hypothetical protein